MGLLFIPMFIVGIIMFIKSPALLESRLNGKEKESEQKVVVALSGLMFLSGFIVAGLNYRFNWIELPNIVTIISSIVFVISYILYAEVLRENSTLLRTIEVKKDQKVVDTGLYGIVRHPMYATTILLFLSIPLVLGSIISFVIFLIYPFIIIKRIKNEEKVLAKDLNGYKDYMKKVKYRLIPFIW
jgi:protein-S-isoprenylcysteine O-methyltransferase Ste14